MLLEKANGRYVSAQITLMQRSDIQRMGKGWSPDFNWKIYFQMKQVEVYKIIVSTGRIEGLMALERREDHVWIHLIEKSPFNRGANEQYKYVAHHLFAFAAQKSFEYDAGGFVAFKAKTGLISHYATEYGAVLIGGNRMFIPDIAGQRLINVYLN